jgi:sigma-B regulation protein RsbU (phosphoserine phosphatase)
MDVGSASISILLVDDDRIHSRILEARLKSQGYQITIAESGERALEEARRNQPTLILCDWLMEGMDGLEVCRQIKADQSLEGTHFILLTSRSRVEDRVIGLDCGADDFLSKPVDPEELLARVRSGIRLHQANERLQLLAAELKAQKDRLDQELAEAAGYVRSILPQAIVGSVSVDACFEPSQELGGDSYDYFWIDDDHFVIYLADASGHGLAAAFPSISIHNQLRSRSLNVNHREPAHVLHALNTGFQMEHQQGRYLTMWYGVYQLSTRILRYASAGHPPALLWTDKGGSPLTRLTGQGMALGLFEDASYSSECCTIDPQSSLLVYSDGIYEIAKANSQMWSFPEFLELMQECHTSLHQEGGLDTLLKQIKTITGTDQFNDDYSVIRATFH